MNPRTGRPPSKNPHGKVVSVRLTQAEYDLVVTAAEKAGVGIGPWMRDRIVAAAKRTR
jgi:hypothetical protein